MLENLSLGDETKLVEAVKTNGVAKSGLADAIEGIAAKCVSEKDDEALAAFASVTALAERAPKAEAFTKICLGPGKM